MSSGTSTDAAVVPTTAADRDAPPSASALKPWQFFLLAGMLGATASVVVATGQSMASIVTLSLTIVATSMVGLGMYRVLLPFVNPLATRPPEAVGGRARAALQREKLLVLRAIKDLEFDHAMGKIAPADFEEMAARLRSRAVGLMQRLEGSGAYRERIEAELATRLSKTPASKAAPARAPAASTRACSACGTGNDTDARFCKSCGAKLEASQ